MDSVLDTTKSLEVGVALNDALSLNSWEMEEPAVASRLVEIADYLNNHPDPTFLISVLKRSNAKVNSRPIDHFYSYVKLQQERGGLMEKVGALEKQIKYYE